MTHFTKIVAEGEKLRSCYWMNIIFLNMNKFVHYMMVLVCGSIFFYASECLYTRNFFIFF